MLTFQEGYACRHSGACCSSDWPIPVEADRLETLRAAVADGRLRPVTASAGGPFLEVAPPQPSVGHPDVLLATHASRCVFHDASSSRCAIHAALGHAALPLACRQFPRQSVIDPRGVSVVLSHYCPTAASLLSASARSHDAVNIVVRHTASDGRSEYVGLDARTSLPPRLRPDMLMDWESWWQWEARSIVLLADARATPRELLNALRAAVEHVRTWRPTDGSLEDLICTAFGGSHRSAEFRRRAPLDLDDVWTSIPEDLRSAVSPPACNALDDGTVRRFLMAHAFANWTAHLGEGLRAWLRSIEAAHALLLEGYDVRQTDLILRHLVEPDELARRLSAVERQ